MEQFDIDRARADTPGCERVVHLNNAGSSLPPSAVTDAVVGYLQREAIGGGYETYDAELPAIERYRSALAEVLGARSTEIAFAASDTNAWSTAFWGLQHTGAVPPRSTVVVDRTCYVSHYLGLLQAHKYFDVTVAVAEADADGTIDLGSLASLIDERVSMVALTHVGTHRGLVNPIEAAGRVVRQSGDAIYLVDACQSLGHLPLDVSTIGCDVLTATGRKYLRGPRGSGVLFVAERLIERIDPPGIDGSGAVWIDSSSYELLGDARRFEPYEASSAVKVGLGVAADYALSWGIAATSARIGELAEYLRAGLVGIGAEVLDGGERRCGIVTFRQSRRSPLQTKALLAAAGINVSVASGASARLDMEPRGVPSAVRASIHYYNTVAELDRVIEALSKP
jgi:cysteine desulfurase / selenocysteine lyase